MWGILMGLVSEPASLIYKMGVKEPRYASL